MQKSLDTRPLVNSKMNYFSELLRIHPALLRKDNTFKTLPIGKLVKILALIINHRWSNGSNNWLKVCIMLFIMLIFQVSHHTYETEWFNTTLPSVKSIHQNTCTSHQKHQMNCGDCTRCCKCCDLFDFTLKKIS